MRCVYLPGHVYLCVRVCVYVLNVLSDRFLSGVFMCAALGVVHTLGVFEVQNTRSFFKVLDMKYFCEQGH